MAKQQQAMQGDRDTESEGQPQLVDLQRAKDAAGARDRSRSQRREQRWNIWPTGKPKGDPGSEGAGTGASRCQRRFWRRLKLQVARERSIRESALPEDDLTRHMLCIPLTQIPLQQERRLREGKSLSPGSDMHIDWTQQVDIPPYRDGYLSDGAPHPNNPCRRRTQSPPTVQFLN